MYSNYIDFSAFHTLFFENIPLFSMFTSLQFYIRLSPFARSLLCFVFVTLSLRTPFELQFTVVVPFVVIGFWFKFVIGHVKLCVYQLYA